MFTDERRRIVWDQIRQHDFRAFAQWLSPELLAAAAKAGVKMGREPLYVVNLTWLAAAAALHTSKSFTDVLMLTLKLLADCEDLASTPLGKERNNAKRRNNAKQRSKHDPRRGDGTVVGEEVFTKARRCSPAPRTSPRPHGTKTRITGCGKRMLPGKLPPNGTQTDKKTKRAA